MTAPRDPLAPPRSTRPGTEPALASPNMWREIRNRHLALAHRRPSLLKTVAVATLSGLTYALTDFPAWRIAFIILIPLVMQVVDRVVLRKRMRDRFDHAFSTAQVIGMFGMALLVTITGGLQGPFMPFMFLVVLLPVVLFGYSRLVIMQQVVVVALIVVIGFLPEAITGPPLPKEQHTAVVALLAAVGLSMISIHMRDLVRAAKAGLAELERMREERVIDANERLQRMQLVSSRIAHELKNPLAAASSLVQLTSKSVDDKARERLAVVQDELSRMEVILRDYLSYSRPLDDLRLSALDLDQVLDDVREVLSGRAAAAGITLTAETPPTRLHGDPRRLKEALINLLGNAIEASASGGQVALSCAATPSGATLVIRDSGRGMTPDELARVGDPFYTKRPGGTGLGVHLARGVVAQHGGTMRYDSVPGVGTTVTIQLPHAPPAASGPSLSLSGVTP